MSSDIPQKQNSLTWRLCEITVCERYEYRELVNSLPDQRGALDFSHSEMIHAIQISVSTLRDASMYRSREGVDFHERYS